jgi:hypothetical protein
MRLSGWPKTGEVLSIECPKRSFDGLTNPNNSFFNAWTQERDPELIAIEQTRTARG